MLCPKCGKEWREGAKFCSGCGAALESGPVSAPAPKPVPVASGAKGRRVSGAVTALLVAVGVLAAAIGLLLALLLGGGGDPSPNPSDLPAVEANGPMAPSGSLDAGEFDAAIEGVYYCAQEAGSTLELRVVDGQLSIYKTYYGSLDVSTLIPIPTSNPFTIDYDGRSIEFVYSSSGNSVTVSEAGYSSLFTADGDRSWVIDAAPQAADPFSDPNGYILPTDSQYITEADLYPYSEEEVKLIRNEIYARYGYSFTMDKFQAYFNSKNWYTENPDVNVSTFGSQQMNQYERANVDTIQNYEEMMGW